MCIALLSTEHPDYPFILLNNRDEFLNRPTLPADWWDAPNEHVLGGRDLQRPARGTWLGITRQGRFAVLTNFREEGAEVTKDKSRGAVINAYITSPPDNHEQPRQFAARLINDVGIHDVGGFSLLFGRLQAPKDGRLPGLSVLSNRSASADSLPHIATTVNETHGLSNSHFGDATWPKVVEGEQLLREAIQKSLKSGSTQTDFIDCLFDILSISKLRQQKPDEDWDVYVRQMRNSILIPPVRSAADAETKTAARVGANVNGTSTPDHGNVRVTDAGYGTQKQTVILVDNTGHVRFVERTLFDENGRSVEREHGAKVLEFDIEGWQE